MRHAPLSLTAMVATLAVALGGCGGAATTVDDLPADAVFLTAVDRSTDVSTARVEYESTSSRDDHDAPLAPARPEQDRGTARGGGGR